MSLSGSVARGALRRSRISPALKSGYADLYEEHGVTHELTISLGLHPRAFDPETEFLPLMRNVVREITQRLRGVPKRQRLKLRPEDAVFMAGFYEATDRACRLFPHWHGVVALQPGEEPRLREVLTERVARDETPGFKTGLPTPVGRSILRLNGPRFPIRLDPTFDLKALTSVETYIGYANKKFQEGDPVHWTTYDFLQN